MKTFLLADNVSILVLSPKILPLVTLLDGSIVKTANFNPRLVIWFPKDSINVLLPAPGTPVIPILIESLFLVFSLASILFANSWSESILLSERVIAFDNAVIFPFLI